MDKGRNACMCRKISTCYKNFACLLKTKELSLEKQGYISIKYINCVSINWGHASPFISRKNSLEEGKGVPVTWVSK